MTNQPFITWQKHWCVGVPVLDQEHRRLVERINLLFAGAWSRHVVLIGTFEKLEDELTRHMIHESEMLAGLGYHDVDGHRIGLETLSRQLGNMREKIIQMCRGGNDSINKEAETFLRQWIVDCLEGNDGHYAAWLRMKGLIPNNP
ncbi:MAG: hypothetical protein HQL67_07105 [Magnetococcales bacterium]|nr:hypothetical protein [Magnetococcales bacterium]